MTSSETGENEAEPAVTASKSLTVRGLLAEAARRPLAVPFFQRPYVWTSKELSRLGEQVQVLLEPELEDGIDPPEPARDAHHFLGAIVTGQNDEVSDVIDGQQRLVTLIAFIAVIGSRNHELSTQASELIFHEGAASGLAVTPSHYAQAAFVEHLRALYPGTDLQDPDANDSALATEAATRIRFLFRWCDAFVTKLSLSHSIEDIFDAVVNRTEIVHIDVQGGVDAYEVFDALNSVGVPLGTFDLVRNVLFQIAQRYRAQPDDLYESFWRPFEDLLGPNPSTYFHPLALTIKRGVRKDDMYNAFRTRWRAHGPQLAMRDLEHYVPEYRALTGQPIDQDFYPTEVLEAISQLNRARIPGSLYAYLFQLLRNLRDEWVDTDQVVEVLSYLESFLIRRAVMGLEPTGLHTAFRSLWGPDTKTARGIHERLSGRGTLQVPTQRDFAKGLITLNARKRKIAHYFLESLLDSESLDLANRRPLTMSFIRWDRPVRPDAANFALCNAVLIAGTARSTISHLESKQVLGPLDPSAFETFEERASAVANEAMDLWKLFTDDLLMLSPDDVSQLLSEAALNAG